MPEEFQNDKKIKPLTVVWAVAVFFAAYLVVIGILIYGFDSTSAIVRKTASIVPYPAAIVSGTDLVSYAELKRDLDSIKLFYESQDFSQTGLRVDFATANGQKRLKIKEKNLLNKLIENRIIERLARQRGIVIGSKEVSQTVERKMKEYGSQETVRENLLRLYGWKIGDFEERIVKPDLYREALEKNVRENDLESQEARGRIEKADAALKNKEEFVKVAEKYSEGESAKNGGELGWLDEDQMIPEISVVVRLMDKGGKSGIIESAIGYHIIELEDKKTEDGIAKFKLRQIFARTKGFPDWLLEQEKGIKILIPLKDFEWDTQTQIVEFQNAELKDFESNLEKNSPGDISILF